MKKFLLFTISMSLAFGITYYTKRQSQLKMAEKNSAWKTFVKKSDKTTGYQTTKEEFAAARITPPSSNEGRAPSSISSTTDTRGLLMRDGRVLTGDINPKYEDEETPLKMVNTINPNWKDDMGNYLIRFHPESTKLIVKEELSLIKIREGQGRYFEQVAITYLDKNGDRSSFRALVDSETGALVETWDRTIHERIGRPRKGISLPSVNESDIVTR